jgi:Cys-rich four helix bundle protein (predicted Tat secretion target)
MNRKEFLKSSTAAAFALSAVSGLASKDHDHSGITGMSSSPSRFSKAMMSAIHCKLAAENCLSHCIDQMGKGDKTMAACAKSTREVISVCNTFIQLASMESNHTSKIAAVCAAICKDCAAECKKHEKHHPICKECMDACLDCEKELRKL